MPSPERVILDGRSSGTLDGERERIGIPSRHWTALDNLHETPAVQRIRAFLADPRLAFLVLGGRPGTGKTVAASHAVEVPHVIRSTGRCVHGNESFSYEDARPTTGRFIRAADLAAAPLYGNDDFWRPLGRVYRLAIDDLGTEQLDARGFALARLADLLCQRYECERKTILTTNLDRDEFSNRYLNSDGGRLLDRFRQGGRFYVIPGESLRVPTTDAEPSSIESLRS